MDYTLSSSDLSEICRFVFDSSQEGLLITDRQGIILVANPRLYEIFGYEEDELVGKPVETLLPGALREKHQSLRAGFVQKPENRPMGTGRELFGRRKDGHHFPLEVSLSHFTRQGELFVSAIVSDISPRKKIEEQLNRQKKFNSAVFQIVGACIVILDREGRILRFNQFSERLLQYKEEDVKGKFIWDLFLKPEDAAESREAIEWLLKGNRKQNFESRWIARNGEEKWISWSNTVVLDNQRKPQTIISTGIDVTARKTMEDRLIDAAIEGQESERHRIAEDLHDGIGPVLSTIKLQMETIREEELPPAERTERLDHIIRLLDSAMKEVRSISHNLIPNTLKDFGLPLAMSDLCSNISSSGKLKVNFFNFGVGRLSYPREIGLYRIAQEGINNALKYSGANEINLQLVRHEHSVVMMLEDDGSGFDYETIRNEHSGLGLRNMASRVKSLRGKLDIDSREGAGTTITIEIPLE